MRPARLVEPKQAMPQAGFVRIWTPAHSLGLKSVACFIAETGDGEEQGLLEDVLPTATSNSGHQFEWALVCTLAQTLAQSIKQRTTHSRSPTNSSNRQRCISRFARVQQVCAHIRQRNYFCDGIELPASVQLNTESIVVLAAWPNATPFRTACLLVR